jgi:hypothetical protein
MLAEYEFTIICLDMTDEPGVPSLIHTLGVRATIDTRERFAIFNTSEAEIKRR